MRSLKAIALERRDVELAYQEISHVETYTLVYTSPIDRRTKQQRNVSFAGTIVLHALLRDRENPKSMAYKLRRLLEDMGLNVSWVHPNRPPSLSGDVLVVPDNMTYDLPETDAASTRATLRAGDIPVLSLTGLDWFLWTGEFPVPGQHHPMCFPWPYEPVPDFPKNVKILGGRSILRNSAMRVIAALAGEGEIDTRVQHKLVPTDNLQEIPFCVLLSVYPDNSMGSAENEELEMCSQFFGMRLHDETWGNVKTAMEFKVPVVSHRWLEQVVVAQEFVPWQPFAFSAQQLLSITRTNPRFRHPVMKKTPWIYEWSRNDPRRTTGAASHSSVPPEQVPVHPPAFRPVKVPILAAYELSASEVTRLTGPEAFTSVYEPRYQPDQEGRRQLPPPSQGRASSYFQPLPEALPQLGSQPYREEHVSVHERYQTPSRPRHSRPALDSHFEHPFHQHIDQPVDQPFSQPPLLSHSLPPVQAQGALQVFEPRPWSRPPARPWPTVQPWLRFPEPRLLLRLNLPRGATVETTAAVVAAAPRASVPAAVPADGFENVPDMRFCSFEMTNVAYRYEYNRRPQPPASPQRRQPEYEYNKSVRSSIVAFDATTSVNSPQPNRFAQSCNDRPQPQPPRIACSINARNSPPRRVA